MKLIERVAARAGTTVAALAARVPHSTGSSAGGQGAGQQITWSAHIWQEVERLANLILPCFRGGYSRVQQLIAHMDALRFALKHKITESVQVDFRGESSRSAIPTLLGVAELLLKVLEIEAERFDQRAEPDPRGRR